MGVFKGGPQGQQRRGPANGQQRPRGKQQRQADAETETLQDGEEIKARLDLKGQHVGEDAREQVENPDAEQGTGQ